MNACLKDLITNACTRNIHLYRPSLLLNCNFVSVTPCNSIEGLSPGLIKYSFVQVGVILSLGFTARIKTKVNDLTEVGEEGKEEVE